MAEQATITGYQLVDSHTGQVLKLYTVEQRNAGRRRADKLDNAYGACRYQCKPVYSINLKS